MRFPDVDLLRTVVQGFPDFANRLRWEPLAFRWEGKWRTIERVRVTASGIALKVVGVQRSVRLDFESDPQNQQAARDGLLRTVLLDNPGFTVVRLLEKTDRTRHQTGSVLRLLLQRTSKTRLVLATDPFAPAEMRDRILIAAVLWWDQMNCVPSHSELRLYIPAEWSSGIAPFFKYLKLPLQERTFQYSADLGFEVLESGLGVDTNTSVADAETVLPSMSALPAVLAEVQKMYPQLDLHARKGKWELGYRGLPLLWQGPGNQVTVHPGEVVSSFQDCAATFQQLVEQVRAYRRFPPSTPLHDFYRNLPERWLESLIVKKLPRFIYCSSAEVYSQVPTYLGQHRKVLDLITVDCRNRLVVVELKVEKELELIFQALDYWRRVKLHQQNGDFTRQGYFPARKLSTEPPRMVLIAPLFEFHRVLATLRRYLIKEVEFECLGVSSDWRRELRILKRFTF